MGLQFRHERTDLYRKGGRSNNRECFCCPRISSRPPLLTHKAFLMTKNSNKTLKSISAFVNGELCFVTMSLLFCKDREASGFETMVLQVRLFREMFVSLFPSAKWAADALGRTDRYRPRRRSNNPVRAVD